MKWLPGELRPGDMIRVRLGTCDHYGVFISEDEVIQFGYPPLERFASLNDPPSVTAVDIDTFACGRIPEHAVPGFFERRKKRSVSEVIQTARNRLGETGYELLTNNCEHFAWECVFGIKKSVREDELRARWLSRPVLDVYLAPIPEVSAVKTVYPPERDRYNRDPGNPEVMARRYGNWVLLGTALRRSFDLDPGKLKFKRDKTGKWVCPDVYFSLSDTEGWSAAAVSNSSVGVDMESIPEFLRKTPKERAERLKKKICTELEKKKCKSSSEELLRLWTLKESRFKETGGPAFCPDHIEAEGENAACYRIEEAPLAVSVSGKELEHIRFWLVENENIRLIAPKTCENGRDLL